MIGKSVSRLPMPNPTGVPSGKLGRGVSGRVFRAITTPVLAGMEPFPKSAHQKSSGLLFPRTLGKHLCWEIFDWPSFLIPLCRRWGCNTSCRIVAVAPNAVRRWGGGAQPGVTVAAVLPLYQKATSQISAFDVELA